MRSMIYADSFLYLKTMEYLTRDRNRKRIAHRKFSLYIGKCQVTVRKFFVSVVVKVIAK